jgi:hypothetical protein
MVLFDRHHKRALFKIVKDGRGPWQLQDAEEDEMKSAAEFITAVQEHENAIRTAL